MLLWFDQFRPHLIGYPGILNIFQAWIFFRVNIFQGWIFFRGGYLSEVKVFQGWIFFFGRGHFQGCISEFHTVLILGLVLSPNGPNSYWWKFDNSQYIYLLGVLAKHSIMVRASIRLSRFCLSCSSTASSSSPIKQARENRNSPFLKVAREYGVEGKSKGAVSGYWRTTWHLPYPPTPHPPTPHPHPTTQSTANSPQDFDREANNCFSTKSYSERDPGTEL